MTQAIVTETRLTMLADKLPAYGGNPVPVTCKGCGAWLSLVANRAGFVTGQLPGWQANSGAAMVENVVLIDERKLSLKCLNCGRVTRWRR